MKQDVVSNITETPHLLEILIAMEDVMDSFDIYVFKNWIKGVVVEGPRITRYDIAMTLRYSQDCKPDWKGGLRLKKHGVGVVYRNDKQNEHDDEVYWLVELTFPRKLMAGMIDSGSDFYTDEVDVEDVDDAVEMGVDDETGLTNENQ